MTDLSVFQPGVRVWFARTDRIWASIEGVVDARVLDVRDGWLILAPTEWPSVSVDGQECRWITGPVEGLRGEFGMVREGDLPEPAQLPLRAQGEGDGHASSCATHNEPAYPNGPCDCGAEADDAMKRYPEIMGRLREAEVAGTSGVPSPELKLECLRLAHGDIERAKEVLAFVAG